MQDNNILLCLTAATIRTRRSIYKSGGAARNLLILFSVLLLVMVRVVAVVLVVVVVVEIVSRGNMSGSFSDDGVSFDDSDCFCIDI